LPRETAKNIRTFIKNGFKGPASKRFFEAKGAIGGSVPVAVLPGRYVKLIGAQTNIVQLSADTLKKNIERHPEITVHDYLNLQTIIENAQVIVQDGENTLVFIETGDRIYHAAIKATETGKGVFMTSLRKTNRKAIKEALRMGKIIKK
jgi:hypothetical protein